jgi:DinB family protein
MPADAGDLRYPIGRYAPHTPFSDASRAATIASIEQTPAKFRRASAGLTDAQLDTPYRPDGWTVRQVVHHLADAHMVLYARTKIALTEDNPPVKMWDEVTWAELLDARSMPIDGSLAIIDAVHARLVHLLETLTPDQFGRTMKHPEWGVVSIDWLVGLCAWHGEHHTAHVSELRKRRGW